MAFPRTPITTWSVAVAATAAIVAPLWTHPGYLLYRDAVSTPRTFLTDTTLGIGPNPPRAVPQDGLLALVGTVIDGGLAVNIIIAVTLILAAAGYGTLAVTVIPDAGPAAAGTAALAGVWNPYVAERLLQGHWSLLTGYAALGWVLVAAHRLRQRDIGGRERTRAWALLYVAALGAALTPTGSVIATVVVVVSLTAPTLRRRRWRTGAASLAATIVAMIPWVSAVALGTSSTTALQASIPAFGLRAEPGLGRIGTALGLGGIWNADAVPVSRDSWWAAVATACLLTLVAVGCLVLFRRRAALDAQSSYTAVVALGLAAVTLAGVLVASTAPGVAALQELVSQVGGAGLLRDTQKYLMLVVPAWTIAVGAAAAALRRWVPESFALAMVGLAVVAPLPDLAWGVGGEVSTIRYPAEWRDVAATVTADDGAVALWPGETVRQWPFTSGPSLDPTSRLVRAAVVESGGLRVDGIEVDAPNARARQVHTALTDPQGSTTLANLGVGWVLVSDRPAPPAVAGMRPEFRGPTLSLYRIPSASDAFAASSSARWTATAALTIWLACFVLALGWLATPSRRSP